MNFISTDIQMSSELFAMIRIEQYPEPQAEMMR
jgi:hypothetical protein